MARKILLSVAMALVAAIAAGAWLFFYRPLTVNHWMEQRELQKGGFQKSVLEAPTGKLVVWEAGQGPVVILLHGAGDQAAVWSKVAPRLAGRYRVVVPDLPGHGESEPAEGPLKLSTVLKGVEFLVANRGGGQPVILVGNSMGGWLALLYAREHPERVARVVSVNGGGLRFDNMSSLTPKDREEARQLMALLLDPASPPIPGFVLDDVVRTTNQGPMGRLMAERPDMEALLLDGKLGEIRTPVDLIWGESDRLLTGDFAQRLQSGLPAVRLSLIARCGHVPQRECPLGLGAALEKLLDGPPPEPRAAPADAAAQPAAPTAR